MKKTIIALSIIAVVFLAGCAKKANVPESAQAPAQTTASGAASTQQFTPIADYKEGVDVSIDNVKRENGKTVLEISINNHSFDVSGQEPKNLSNLAGKKPISYTTSGPGHHVESVMSFDGDLRGEFVFGLKKGLVFKFNIP